MSPRSDCSLLEFYESRPPIIFTVRSVVVVRLCYHRSLSFCSQGCVCVSQHVLDKHPPPGRHSPGRPPGQTPPGQTPLRQTPPWRPLQRTVHILLECILVGVFSFSQSNCSLDRNYNNMSDNKAYSAIGRTHLAIIAGNDEQTNVPKNILHWYLSGFFYVGIQPKLPLL